MGMHGSGIQIAVLNFVLISAGFVKVKPASQNTAESAAWPPVAEKNPVFA
ncbi:MAG: hypothetical protein J5828_03360 [Desulfovibrionaceae bacterium]|nr:hypothetical protein [Desulfovibrionaceae bacterium]